MVRKYAGYPVVTSAQGADYIKLFDISDGKDSRLGSDKFISVDDLDLSISGPTSTILDYGADPTGQSNSRQAFVDAEAQESLIEIPEGTYLVSSDLTISVHLLFRGDAKLLPANGVTITLAGGYTANDYQHVFDDSDGGSVKGLQANYVTPQHFGATAEGNTGDDTAAINAAIQYGTLAQVRDEYASTHKVVFPLAPDTIRDYYYVTSDIIVNRNVVLEGRGPKGRTLGAVRIVGSDACDAVFWFAAPGGISAVEPYVTEVGSDFWGAGRSFMTHFVIEPENSGNIDFGIIHNVPVFLRDVTCLNFAKANFFAHGQTSGNSAYGDPDGTDGLGTMWGNTNGSKYELCFASGGAQFGFAAQGNNTQIMVYDTCDASTNNGAGFYDNSSIGCTFVGCHTAQNTWKVLHNGTYYMCVKGHTSGASTEPGTGADWREYWWEITATVKDADWATATRYVGCGGINVNDNDAHGTVVGHYSEGGIEAGIVVRRGSTVVGGEIAGDGRVLRHGQIGYAVVLGGPNANSPNNWKHTNPSSELYGAALGPISGYDTAIFHSFGHSNDSALSPEAWKFRWNDTQDQYGYSYEGNQDVFGFTGSGFSQDGYSGAEHVIAPNGFLIGDASGATPKYARVRSVQNNGAISGTVVKGDIFFYTEPAAGGKVGAVVTTSGTVGVDAVVKEFGVIDT